MSVSYSLSAAEDPVRAWLASDAVRRRATGYGAALILHVVLLAALVYLPPAAMREAGRIGQALELRFYTVAGGPDADTDAPLFEPPLAGGETGTGPIGVDGAENGGEGGRNTEAIQPDAPVAAREPEPDILPAPDPVEVALPDADPIPEPSPSDTPSPADAVLVQTEPDQAPAAPPVTERAGPRSEPVIDPGRTNAPVATAQPGPAVPQEARPAAPITFADIVARAQTRMDPDDFRIIANFAGGVRGTVKDNFCLSSSDANQEAFECPEGSQLAAPRLAQYGLMGLGEEPPEFLEDMDRLAFQLSQTGAGDTAIGRILTSLREARREAINSPDLTRSMQRDSEATPDHLGVSNPFGDDGP